MTHYKVGYLVGSLAAASINRKLARALIRLGRRRELAAPGVARLLGQRSHRRRHRPESER